MRVCRLAVVLRCFLHAAGGEVVEGDDEQRRAQSRQVALDLVARLPGGDRPMRAREHRARVERLYDPHDGHAGFALARDDRAMYRRRPAVPGQQRRVDVEEAPCRDGEDLVRQNFSVGRHDAKVRTQRCQPLEKARIRQALRLEDWHPGRGGSRFDRGIEQLAAPAPRSIRLRDHARHDVA